MNSRAQRGHVHFGYISNHALCTFMQAIVTSTSGNLTHADDRWRIGAVVADSTGTMEVELGGQLLEDLIGFSAREFRENMEPYKSDRAIRARGRQVATITNLSMACTIMQYFFYCFHRDLGFV